MRDPHYVNKDIKALHGKGLTQSHTATQYLSQNLNLVQSDAKAPECNCHFTLERALIAERKGDHSALEKKGRRKLVCMEHLTSAIYSHIGAGTTSRSKSFLNKKRKHYEELYRGTKVHKW